MSSTPFPSGLVDVRLSSDLRPGFPTFVNGMMGGTRELDEMLRKVYEYNSREEFFVDTRRFRGNTIRTGPIMAGLDSGSRAEEKRLEAIAATSCSPAGIGSRDLIFPGVEIRTAARQWRYDVVVDLEPESVVLDHAHPHEQIGILLEGRLDEFTRRRRHPAAWSQRRHLGIPGGSYGVRALEKVGAPSTCSSHSRKFPY